MRPSLRLVSITIVLAIMALINAQIPSLWPEYLGILGLLLIFSCIDALRLYRLPSPEIERTMPAQMALGQATVISYRIRHRSTFATSCFIYDGYPSNWLRQEEPLIAALKPKCSSKLEQKVTPNQRGLIHLRPCQSLVVSPLGLWHKCFTHDLPATTKVLPDFSKILGADLLSLEHWLRLIGIKKSHYAGSSQSFHQLRDFQQGDDLRHIDWKASSKHQKWISKSYEAEHDQQLVFLLDCGRQMRLSDDRLTHFDYALNAMMLLSYAALRHHDAVGLATFAHPKAQFLAAKKNQKQLHHLLEMVYDIEPSQQTPDYALAVQTILQHQKRHSLIVVITHMDQNKDPDLMTQLNLLRQKHTVLIANLQQQQQIQALNAKLNTSQAANAYAGAQMYQQLQSELQQSMFAAKISYTHVLPQELSAALINHYLKFKQHGSW